MAFGHSLDTLPRSLAVSAGPPGRSGPASAGLAQRADALRPAQQGPRARTGQVDVTDLGGRAASPFGDLVALWLADLALRDIAENTKEKHPDDLRRHVRPFFEHCTMGEITTGRVEWFLKSERAVSYSRAKHSRTLLHQRFTFALRNDAMARNPVEAPPLPRPRNQIRALTLEQVEAIRRAGRRGGRSTPHPWARPRKDQPRPACRGRTS